jgi:hypothetical protein
VHSAVGDGSCNGDFACFPPCDNCYKYCLPPFCGLPLLVGQNSCNGLRACACPNPKGHKKVYDIGDGECNREGNDFTGNLTCCVQGNIFPCECTETPEGGLVVGDGDTCTSINRGFNGGTLKCNSKTCQFDTSECIISVCGDGNVDGAEECDADLGSKTCVSLGFVGGILKCNSKTCKFDTSECITSVCGDGNLDGAEECDTDLGSKTCVSLGFLGGTLKCNSKTCQFDTSECTISVCGDGNVDGTEECDTDLGSKTCASMGFIGGTLKCNSETCQFDTSECVVACGDGDDTSACTTCGDGKVEGDEHCEGTDSPLETCAALGFVGGGTLKCNSTNCQFDTSECIGCIGIWCFFSAIWLAFVSVIQGLLCIIGVCL